MRLSEFFNKKGIIFIGLFILTLKLILNFTQLTIPITDPFHFGEFVASATHYSVSERLDFHPLQIHGLNDIIPALLAESIWGDNHHFLPTLTFYKLLNFMSYGLLISAFLLIGTKSAGQILMLISILLVGDTMVSYRDTVLLLSINFFLIIQKYEDNHKWIYPLQILFGVVVAFSLFWSFDRGVAGIIALGIATLVAANRNKKYIVSVIVFLLSIAAFSNVSELFSTTKYIENLIHNISQSSQWSYGFTLNTASLILFAVYVNAFSIAQLVLSFKLIKSNSRALELAIISIILSVFLLKIGINRADLSHMFMTLWAPLLLLHVILRHIQILPRVPSIVTIQLIIATLAFFYVLIIPDFGLVPVVAAIVAAILLIYLLLTVKLLNYKLISVSFILLAVFPFLKDSAEFLLQISKGNHIWITKLKSPPANIELSTDGVVWASSRILRDKNPCLFDLSNNGIINALAKLPSCTKFTYPVYATQEHENELIEQLKNSRVNSVVYSTTFWSYRIDGRSMATRLPELDKYVLNTFPYVECKFDYCIRSTNED